jgi:hypothetical protein
MKLIKFNFLIFLAALILPAASLAQFSPPAGFPGSTAIYKDSSVFIAWAATCSIERGYINIADTTQTYNGLNKTSYGSYLYASGPPDELVVSLGDHGSATMNFDAPIVDGTGPDFAVFENSFGDSFLELGFVEVSSDGNHFVRFPSVSLTPQNQQIGTFDTLDARKINNLAGKYRHAYGTPFDLADLKDSSGINLSQVSWIRIVDTGGCLLDPFATFDSQGHKINDPWPTPFDTGGFDLDALGVIHNQVEGLADDRGFSTINFYPNPVADVLTVTSLLSKPAWMKISDLVGRCLLEVPISGKTTYDISSFPPGIYIAQFAVKDGGSITKKIVKK